jgi:hypothetical protein
MGKFQHKVYKRVFKGEWDDKNDSGTEDLPPVISDFADDKDKQHLA